MGQDEISIRRLLKCIFLDFDSVLVSIEMMFNVSWILTWGWDFFLNESPQLMLDVHDDDGEASVSFDSGFGPCLND